MAEKQTSGATLGIFAVLGAGAVAAGLYFGGIFDPEDEQIAAVPISQTAEPTAPTVDGTVPPSAAETTERPEQSQAAPETVDATEDDLTEEAAPDEPLAEETPVAEADEPEAPVIDEVRVEPDGLAIIAGRGAPGSTMAVLLDGIENTTAPVEANGTFAAITLLDPSDQTRVLTLVQRDGTTDVASVDEIILAPVKAVTPEPEVALADVESTEELNEAETDLTALSGAEGAATAVEREGAEAAPLATDNVETANSTPSAQAPVGDTTAAIASVSPEVGSAVAEIGGVSAVESSVSPSLETDERPRLSSTTSLTAENAETELALANQSATRSPAPLDRATPVEPGTPSLQGREVTGTGSGEPRVAALPESDESADDVTEDVPTRVAILRSTEDGVEVLSQPDVQDNVSIDTISYSSVGNVELSGRAQQESRSVRVYINNRPVTTLDVDTEGRWRGDLPDVDTGVYRLRVDEISSDGSVVSRIETPFKREDPQVIEDARKADPTKAKNITVQTGHTLWAIARERYGDGVLYVQIFEANKSSIRNPDLIFPGQVFDLPDE